MNLHHDLQNDYQSQDATVDGSSSNFNGDLVNQKRATNNSRDTNELKFECNQVYKKQLINLD